MALFRHSDGEAGSRERRMEQAWQKAMPRKLGTVADDGAARLKQSG
jgi:hypothetical protein